MNVAARRAPAPPRPPARAFDRRGPNPSCEWNRRFIWPGTEGDSHGAWGTMTAVMSWFVTVLTTLALVLVLNQLGVDVMAGVGSLLQGTIRVLSQPLIAL
jgi:hypothetical protein